MRRASAVIGAVCVLVASALLLVSSAATEQISGNERFEEFFAQMGLGPRSQPVLDFLGPGITECPHAGEPADKNPKPLDRRQIDRVEQLSNGGDDVKVNQDYSCLPQNETSIAVSPTNPRNVVAGQNDYRLGWGSSGFNSSTDNGNHWYDGIRDFPTPGNPTLSPLLASDDHIDGGGDPAVVFDRAGIVYYVDIHFERERDDNGIFVSRSTNGGFTWTRPCVPIDATTPPNPTDDRAVCGGNGDPRRPGDGVVVYDRDPDGTGPASAPFNDKEYMTAGPVPSGTPRGCFAPETKTFIPAGTVVPNMPGRSCPSAIIGVDRLYVTWTKFPITPVGSTKIYFSYSDDQGRSWSPEKAISGDASFCDVVFFDPVNRCDRDQTSTPTVNPTNGWLWVGFENFNTPDVNQYLVVRSRDGGQTFDGPFHVTPVFDVNYPDAGGDRPDCTDRGQQSGRAVLTNSCFRVDVNVGNTLADKRGGAFADDVYAVIADNRNGTRESTNTDVFLFKSTDGGMTWIGPTRVNNDPLNLPSDFDRDCSPGDTGCGRTFGNDQWFPWMDISSRGDLNVVFHDRRLDMTSTLSEWPDSRSRPGNYLGWFWGGVCSITTTATVSPNTNPIPAAARQCVAPEAQLIYRDPHSPVPNPPNPGGFPQPGNIQGTFPLRNFTVSDSPSNLDYSFRAGIFMGDYSNVAIGPDNTAYGFWTDARNGRSSRSQGGRNPACEQSDVFADSWSAQSGGSASNPPSQSVIDAYSVTPCPTDMRDPGNITLP
jgi:hypothetical protein